MGELGKMYACIWGKCFKGMSDYTLINKHRQHIGQVSTTRLLGFGLETLKPTLFLDCGGEQGN